VNAFAYKNGALHCEDVALARIAGEVGTPVFVYSSGAILARFRAYAAAFPDAHVCYALKANSNLAILRLLAREGAGADVVSGGELELALAAGVPSDKIVFSGVGKSRAEIRRAIEAGIGQINVESEAELGMLSETAAGLGKRVAVALRVNPDVDPKTHAKITTGKKENKFGVAIDAAPGLYARGSNLPGLRMVGFAVHIGSQLVDLAPYRSAFAALGRLTRDVRAQGLTVERLDLGGGLGIVYRDEAPPSIEAYAEAARREVGNLGCHLSLEPGRSLVGNAGALLASVILVKDGGKRFVVIDAAMNDLIRPTLYEAYHEILPIEEPAPGAPRKAADVVGPICETGDILASHRPLPDLREGSKVAILSAGAYGAVMASSYNARPLAAEVLVKGGEFAVVRPRQSIEELIARDRVPDWLGGPPTSRDRA
jgi:diaminopimelate decarboxylase